MGLAALGIESNGPLRRRERSRTKRIEGDWRIQRLHGQCRSELRIGAREHRVLGNGLLEILDRRLNVLAALSKLGESAQVEVV